MEKIYTCILIIDTFYLNWIVKAVKMMVTKRYFQKRNNISYHLVPHVIIWRSDASMHVSAFWHSKVNIYTFRRSNCHFHFVFILNGGQLLKEKKIPAWSKLFPLMVDPSQKDFDIQRSKQEVKELSPIEVNRNMKVYPYN